MKLLSLALTLLFFPSIWGAETLSLQLSPGMKPLPLAEATPPLHVPIPEATSPKDGLMLTPEVPFQWAYLNSREEPLRFRIDSDDEIFSDTILTIWNWNNRPVFRKKLPAGQSFDLKIKLKGLGVYQFTLEGYEAEKCTKRLVRSFAVTEDLNRAREIWKTDEFFLGVCALSGRYHWLFEGKPTIPDGIYPHAARELEAELMARLGFQVVRVDESMEMGSDIGNGYRYHFKRMDAVVNAYTSRGMKLALQLMNAPDWAIHPKYDSVKSNLWRYPRQPEPQKAYIKALLNRYGKHTRFVQVFNEPDQTQFWAGTPDEFIEQFRYTKEMVEPFDLPVVNGGYSLFEPEKTAHFAGKLKGELNQIAYHCHGDLKALIEDYNLVKTLHREAGYSDPDFINTEMGFDGWRLDQELRKGQYVPQKTLYCWANDHSGVLLFGSRMTQGPYRRSQDFGFIDHFFCPRYVYGSIGAMVSTLAGATFHSVVLEDGNHFIYRFQKGSETILSAFSLEPDSPPLQVKTNALQAVVVDPMGNQRDIEKPDTIALQTGNYPVYLKLEAESDIVITIETPSR
ncbi:MAG: hypothetical protein P1U89_12875 [Verrucomicrobiales bacterium]|nr:hypothetical protein [Verrucomicrobiales bacterium]